MKAKSSKPHSRKRSGTSEKPDHNAKSSSKLTTLLRSKTQTALVIVYCILFVALGFNSIGALNLWPHPLVKSNPYGMQLVLYDLQWQNQQGQPFSPSNMTGYRWFDIDLFILGRSNFTQNSIITMYAQGTMSAYLANSSLAAIGIAYDGAVPYETGYVGVPGIMLEVVPNGTFPMNYAIGPTVSVFGNPVNMTWRFAGGPHYPTLTIQYWSGSSIKHEDRNAPIMIQPPQPQSPSEPTRDTPDQIGVNWMIGSGMVVFAEAIYLRFPRKRKSN